MSDNPVCTLVLVRHAASQGGARFIGQNDEPLSAAGRKQMKRLVEKLSRFRFEAVYASDLTRTRETAGTVARGLNLELKIRPALREIAFRSLAGIFLETNHTTRPAPRGPVVARFSNAIGPGSGTLHMFQVPGKARIQNHCPREPGPVRVGCDPRRGHTGCAC